MTLVQTATILIVEDEVIIAETLSAMLKNMGCRVSKIAHNLDEFRRAFQHGNLDFVFLDINLNGQHEGLRLASECQEAGIPFVFITSYSDKNTISSAISLKPLAYINKPFSELDLFKVCEMMKSQLESDSGTLKVKDGHDTVHLKYSKIKWLQAENVYTLVITDSKKYLLRISLKDILAELPEHMFFRTHRSYAINLKRLERVSSDSVNIDGQSIPLSRTNKALLNQRMG